MNDSLAIVVISGMEHKRMKEWSNMSFVRKQTNTSFDGNKITHHVRKQI